MITKILKTIDAISEYSGRITSWICVAIVVVLCYETFARYLFNAPTVWAHVITMMMFGAICIMGLGHVERYGSHIRVDVVYRFFSPRVKAIVDVLQTIILLFPLLYYLLKVSIFWMMRRGRARGGRQSTVPTCGSFRTVVLGSSFFVSWDVYAICSLLKK
jgi:TRAP-type mannitol/chloroaromatic compound transport system permease small subunit